ncbi:MAG: hypothetical protein F6K00_05570 [Leptolyngbya sp. SIOISBB]|nr:hypothetical protein [Leptolyngbya sp. SIOISBB]
MTLRLRTSHYRFIYSFASAHQLVGTVIGDSYDNQPEYIFNLRSLRGLGLTPQGHLMMSFDEVFGQFTLTTAETILSGSHSQKGSFFSINYRNGDACIYDAATDRWITSGWKPERWQIQELPMLPSMMPPKSSRPKRLRFAWGRQAIA